MVADTYARLADTLEPLPTAAWDAPSLCEGWRVREVVAHVTMPSRLSAEQFGAALAEVQGDFQRLSDSVAARDAGLPVGDHLENLRSSVLGSWQPPGGGSLGALNHAVVHALDVTLALAVPTVAPDDALRVLLDAQVAGGAARFDVDTDGHRLVATDLDWAWGTGERTTARAGELLALLCHRTLPDGRTLVR